MHRCMSHDIMGCLEFLHVQREFDTVSELKQGCNGAARHHKAPLRKNDATTHTSRISIVVSTIGADVRPWAVYQVMSLLRRSASEQQHSAACICRTCQRLGCELRLASHKKPQASQSQIPRGETDLEGVPGHQ